MACKKLVKVWPSKVFSAKGKRLMTENPHHAFAVDVFTYRPCKNCAGCRLEHSLQWTIRSEHESSFYLDNCFITLTYSPENLPLRGGVPVLEPDHLSDFWKRLRKHYVGTTSIQDPFTDKWVNPIRYVACGEYGKKFGRPHYHASLFNFNFTDLKVFGNSKPIRGHKSYPLYTSPILEKLWGHGFVNVAPFNANTAAYVARYVMKKVNGKAAVDHYRYVDSDTGEVIDRPKEFSRQSSKPGIGAFWYHKYKNDIYPKDHFVYHGRVMRPPKYYDELFERESPTLFTDMKRKRRWSRPLMDEEFFRDMEAKNVIVEQHVQQFIRSLDYYGT